MLAHLVVISVIVVGLLVIEEGEEEGADIAKLNALPNERLKLLGSPFASVCGHFLV